MNFIALLEGLSSPDGTLRVSAEQHYEALKKESGDRLPMFLIETIPKFEIQVHLRKLSAVLLRRILIEQEESVYRSMSESA